MLTLTKKTFDDIEYTTLERLYNEAFPYLSAERQRVGDVELKKALIDEIGQRPMIQYEIDGYTVGIACYMHVSYQNKLYMWHRHPLYGNDLNGSRAWWFSEEFQLKSAEYVRDNGYSGIITFMNPSSPAAQAVIRHFGIFNAHFKPPVSIEPSLLSPDLSSSESKLSAIMIDLYE